MISSTPKPTAGDTPSGLAATSALPWSSRGAWLPGRPVRVLELRSALGAGGGPEKTILLGAARTDPRRAVVTVCYLRDARDVRYSIDSRASRLGVDYVEIRERHSFDPGIWPSLRRLVRDRRIDIVHAHEYKTDLLALLLHRTEGVVPLATVHGWIGNTRRERLYSLVDRRLLARFPLVVAVSKRIRDDLIAHGADPARVRHLRNAIDHGYFRRPDGVRDRLRKHVSLAPDATVLGAVTRLGPEKRLDLLLEAAARLRGPLDPVVVIAGAGRCAEALQAQARARGLAGSLHLIGHQDDVRAVYPAFDVYVQSSDTEGVPNAVLEAMALEVPVVATDVGGTGELVDDGVHGLLVPPGDPEALARAIALTLAEPAATARRVDAARARVETELSFDTRTRALEALYAELMGRVSPPGVDEPVLRLA